jgi:hypothetical protein
VDTLTEDATELLNRASAVDPALALVISRDRHMGLTDDEILLLLCRAIAGETKRRENLSKKGAPDV